MEFFDQRDSSFSAPTYYKRSEASSCACSAVPQAQSNRSSDPSRIGYKSKHNENIKFYSKRPLVNVCYPCVAQFHNEPPAPDHVL